MRSRRSPLHVCRLSTLVLFAAGCGSGGDRRPNVLLVTLDTTRADSLGSYNGTPGTTPAFDELAEEGVLFQTAVSASGVTPVSHATILTGLYPYRHGLRVLSAAGGFRLPDASVMLSTILKEEGYATGAVHSAYPVSGDFGFRRDFDYFESFDEASMEVRVQDGKTGWDTRMQRRSDATTDLVLGYLDGLPAESDVPFFAWVHYWDPHDPTVMPPEEFWRPRLPKDEPLQRDALYAIEVEWLDRQFGRLIEGLQERGLYENTLILVTSDHGEGLSDGEERHGWGMHRMVYQEQIHVPLILRLPEGPRGRVVEPLVRTVDIVPTVLDYVGLDAHDIFDGASLRPLVEGRDEAPRSAYADQINGYDLNASMVERRPDAAFLYCEIDGRWKLTFRPHMPDRSELFDLEADPEERNNVLAQHPDVVVRLLQRLAERDPWVLAPFPPDESAETPDLEVLESLGYAQGGSGAAATEWVWVCPEHPEHRTPERGRHGECGALLVPVAAD